MPLSPKTKPAQPARTSSASSRRPASKLTGRGPQRTRPDLWEATLEDYLRGVHSRISLLRLAIGRERPPNGDRYHMLWSHLLDLEYYAIASMMELDSPRTP